MDEISELDSAVIAANLNADTVREQQAEIRKLEAENARLRAALAGEIGLVQLLASCDPRPAEITGNHRHVEALDALGQEHD